MYLQRSGRLPLSIQVFEPSVDVDPGNDSDPVSHLWLQILAKHCRRWQFAKLILPSPYYSDDGALAKIYRSLPILQSLEISVAGDTRGMTQNRYNTGLKHVLNRLKTSGRRRPGMKQRGTCHVYGRVALMYTTRRVFFRLRIFIVASLSHNR